MTRPRRTYAVLGFASTHSALDAEKLLGDLGIEVVPIPAPASAGTLCGIALRMEPADEPRALAYLESAGIDVALQTQIEDL